MNQLCKFFSRIIFTCISILIPLLMIGCGSGSLPPSNNTDPAGSIITQLYSAEDLSDLLRGCDNGTYSNLRDLKGKYRIECIRDPREYNEKYMPYVVIMSDSGKKAFLFFEPFEEDQRGVGDISVCILPDSFLSKDEMLLALNDLENAQATWSDWVALLEKYESGMSRGARNHEFVLAVKEGVYGILLSHEEAKAAQHIQDLLFISDYSLIHEPDYVRTIDWDPWLILPIDKT